MCLLLENQNILQLPECCPPWPMALFFTVFLYVNSCSPELKHFLPILSIELEHCKKLKTPPCVTTLLTLTLSVSPTEVFTGLQVVPIGFIH